MYERSYMHRDIVTRIVVTATDFVITARSVPLVLFCRKSADQLTFLKLIA